MVTAGIILSGDGRDCRAKTDLAQQVRPLAK